MVFDWIENEVLDREIKLLLIINDLRMATMEQIQTITGWSYWYFHNSLRRLKRIGKDVVKTYYFGYEKQTVYYLGRAGLEQVNQVLETERKLREQTNSQMAHNILLTEILIRLIKEQLTKHQNVSWLSQNESFEDLLFAIERTNKNGVDIKRVIRPDAKLELNGKNFWIEYDNNTEGSKKLDRKFFEYVQTLTTIGDEGSVVWVSPSEKRTEFLKKTWLSTRKKHFPNGVCLVNKTNPKPIPKMYFFTAGEESAFILNDNRPSEPTVIPEVKEQLAHSSDPAELWKRAMTRR